jgi:hypothetical protein
VLKREKKPKLKPSPGGSFKTLKINYPDPINISKIKNPPNTGANPKS